jgi:hypothetical protein
MIKDLYDIVLDITKRIYKWIFHVEVLVYNNDIGRALDQARKYQQRRLKKFIVRLGLLIIAISLAYNLIK